MKTVSDSRLNLLYLGIMLVIFAAVYFAVPTWPNKARGTVFPAVKNLPAPTTPGAVQIFTQPPLATYTVLGNINLEQNAVVPVNQAQQDLLTRARKLAASVGANGVLIKIFGKAGGEEKYGISQYFFRAQAINITGAPSMNPITSMTQAPGQASGQSSGSSTGGN